MGSRALCSKVHFADWGCRGILCRFVQGHPARRAVLQPCSAPKHPLLEPSSEIHSEKVPPYKLLKKVNYRRFGETPPFFDIGRPNNEIFSVFFLVIFVNFVVGRRWFGSEVLQRQFLRVVLFRNLWSIRTAWVLKTGFLPFRRNDFVQRCPFIDDFSKSGLISTSAVFKKSIQILPQKLF